MKRAILIALVLLAGCSNQPVINSATCGAVCSSSDECRNDPGGCNVCYGGRCTNSLPAQPITDAGVDAPTTK